MRFPDKSGQVARDTHAQLLVASNHAASQDDHHGILMGAAWGSASGGGGTGGHHHHPARESLGSGLMAMKLASKFGKKSGGHGGGAAPAILKPYKANLAGSPEDQLRLAKTLAGLSSKARFCEGIVKEGAIQQLCAFAMSDNAELKSLAANAMRNLSGASSDIRERMLQHHVVPVITNTLSRVNTNDIRNCCAVVLCNLSFVEKSEKYLIDNGMLVALKVLVQCIGNTQTVINAAATGILNMTCVEEKYTGMENVISAVIWCAGLPARTHASDLACAKALSNLARIKGNQTRVVEEGAVPPLCRYTGSRDPELRSVAIGTLCNLSQAEAARPSMMDRRTTDVLIRGTESAHLDVQKLCVLTLCNLATSPDCRIKMVLNGMTHALVRLCERSHDSDVRQICTMALYYMTATANMQSRLVAQGVLRVAVQVARDSVNMNNQDTVDRVAFVLATFLCADHAAGYDPVDVDGIGDAAETLIALCERSATQRVDQMLVLSLYNLSGSEKHRQLVSHLNVIHTLLDICKKGNTATRRFCASALRSFTECVEDSKVAGAPTTPSTQLDYQREVIESGGDILMSLFQSEDEQIRADTAGTFYNLLQHYGPALQTPELYTALLELGDSTHTPTKINAAACFFRLSSWPDNIPELVDGGVVEAVGVLSREESVAPQCIATLSNLCDFKPVVPQIIERGVVGTLLRMSSSNREAIRMGCAICLCCLSRCHGHEELLVRECCHKSLMVIALVTGQGGLITEICAKALVNLMANDKVLLRMVDDGLVWALTRIVRSGQENKDTNEELMKLCVEALCNISANKDAVVGKATLVAVARLSLHTRVKSTLILCVRTLSNILVSKEAGKSHLILDKDVLWTLKYISGHMPNSGDEDLDDNGDSGGGSGASAVAATEIRPQQPPHFPDLPGELSAADKSREDSPTTTSLRRLASLTRADSTLLGGTPSSTSFGESMNRLFAPDDAADPHALLMAGIQSDSISLPYATRQDPEVAKLSLQTICRGLGNMQRHTEKSKMNVAKEGLLEVVGEVLESHNSDHGEEVVVSCALSIYHLCRFGYEENSAVQQSAGKHMSRLPKLGNAMQKMNSKDIQRSLIDSKVRSTLSFARKWHSKSRLYNATRYLPPILAALGNLSRRNRAINDPHVNKLACASLYELSCDEANIFRMVDMHAVAVLDRLVTAAAYPQLCPGLEEDASDFGFRPKSSWEQQQQHATWTREVCAATLLNMSGQTGNHSGLVAASAVALLRRISREEPSAVIDCGRAVCHLSLARVNTTKMVTEGCVSMMVEMGAATETAGSNREMETTWAQAVRKLAYAPGNRKLLVEHGIVRHIVSLINRLGSNYNVNVNCCAAIATLTHSRELHQTMNEQGALEAMVNLANHHSHTIGTEAQRHCADALSRLADSDDGDAQQTHGLIAALMRLMMPQPETDPSEDIIPRDAEQQKAASEAVQRLFSGGKQKSLRNLTKASIGTLSKQAPSTSSKDGHAPLSPLQPYVRERHQLKLDGTFRPRFLRSQVKWEKLAVSRADMDPALNTQPFEPTRPTLVEEGETAVSGSASAGGGTGAQAPVVNRTVMHRRQHLFETAMGNMFLSRSQSKRQGDLRKQSSMALGELFPSDNGGSGNKNKGMGDGKKMIAYFPKTAEEASKNRYSITQEEEKFTASPVGREGRKCGDNTRFEEGKKAPAAPQMSKDKSGVGKQTKQNNRGASSSADNGKPPLDHSVDVQVTTGSSVVEIQTFIKTPPMSPNLDDVPPPSIGSVVV